MIINHSQSPVSEGAEQREATLNAHKTELSDLQFKISDLKEELSKIENDITEANNVFLRETISCEKVRNEYSYQLKELSDLNTKMSELEKSFSTRKLSMDSEVEILNEKANELTKNIGKYQLMANSEEEKYKSKLESNERILMIHNSDIYSKKETINNLDNSIISKTAEVVDLEEKISDISSQLENNKTLLSQISEQIILESSKLKETRDENSDILSKVEAAKTELDYAIKEKDRVVSETGSRLSYFASCELNFEKREKSIKAMEEELNIKHQKFLKDYVSNNN